ncbi:hypothetical protein D3C73_1203090 [compost metagenome]
MIHVPSALTALTKASLAFTMDAVVTTSVVSVAGGCVAGGCVVFSLFPPQPDNNAIATPTTNNPLNSFTVYPSTFLYLTQV